VKYLNTKFHFNSPSGLGCVFYPRLGLAAIFDPRRRLFENVGFFPLPTHTPSYQILYF